MNNRYLDSLSDVQRDAATQINGPTLIIAGAGSGKTRVLTSRITYMLEQGIRPQNIMALTFTNKAAKEMKERMAEIIPADQVFRLRMGTFHSVFARILRAESELLGFPHDFTVYDSSDSRSVIRQILRDQNLSEDQYKPAAVASRISLAKNNLLTPDPYAQNALLVSEDREHKQPQFAAVYKIYCERCKRFGAMDFDDLLLYMNILFRDFPDALRKYQELYQYILVDEYQDTNSAQYLIIKKLAQQHGNICVVGDDSQSIYSFRGAKIENILRFQKDYPAARIFKLEQNYRSTQTIVNAANSVIDNNAKRLKKKVFSAGEVGDKIRVVRAYTDREEASLVCGDIYSSARSNSLPYSAYAILYRTNAQSRVFEESLRRLNIPYKIHGGMSFYQRKEVKDLLGYVRLITNRRDDEALKRVINCPTRGIGDTTVGRIQEAAAANNRSMWEMIEQLTPGQKGPAGKMIQFATLINELSVTVASSSAYDALMEIATRSGIIGSYKMADTPENFSALENIDELLNSAQSFAEGVLKEDPEHGRVSLAEWLETVSLLTDEDESEETDRNYVNLMTIHSAKGLEFDSVYVVGMENNLFPGQRTITSPEGMEEERRLFYVAITRAKRYLMLSYCKTRFQWGETKSNTPSLFLKEIDDRYLDVKVDDEESVEEYDADEIRPRRPFTPRAGSLRLGEERPRQESPRTIPVTPKRSVEESRLRPVGAGSTTTNVDDDSEFAVGDTVSHDKFGRGTVTAIEKSSVGEKITVEFLSSGLKTLLRKFARLRREVGR